MTPPVSRKSSLAQILGHHRDEVDEDEDDEDAEDNVRDENHPKVFRIRTGPKNPFRNVPLAMVANVINKFRTSKAKLH